MAKDSGYIIAVDFDGTCVEHNYPAIGMEVEGAVDVLRALNKRGHRIILNTMRSGEKLDAAVKWFRDRKVELWAVNRNPEQEEWTSSPKVYADLYIDDSALGCPIMFIDGLRKPVVKWSKVRTLLENDGIL
ncbi:MAG: hypothetical protein IKW31_05675 [Alistipes sp.]|jgi:hypothetical protein|nr:hypothetical protein [Alistipes sp.]MBR5201219.1 hypothetical protein [Alistipes sp.]